MQTIINDNELFEPEIVLKNISVKNFRGFEDVNINFDSKLNVVIGDNGSGKTSLIECIVKILSIFVQNIRRKKISSKKVFDIYDFRYDSQKTSLYANFSFNKKQIRFTILFEKNNYESPKIIPYGTKDFRVKIYECDHYKKPMNLPLFAYYPSVNVPLDIVNFGDLKKESIDDDIFSSYDSILRKKYFDFISFFNWYRWQENIEKQIGENFVLNYVRNAIYSILSDNNARFENLSINWLNDPNGEMIISRNDIVLSINQLSSGEKLLLLLVSDLAKRLVIANPHKKNPLNGYGIVLIDEVDLHLHPRWQRSIIRQLQKTFPNCQFVVTTHSPLVLSKVKPSQIIVLRNFERFDTSSYTYGRDTNSILYELMGVTQRPEEAQNIIDKIYELIDNKKLEEAKRLLEKLSEDLGENDHEILRAYTHMYFMEED